VSSKYPYERQIADYKVPDHVVFVDDLPVNATFQVDFGQLKKAAALGPVAGRPGIPGPDTPAKK
jgi:non-ribosomal peptide synthetase component E (peptide arylation enzyme)